MLRRLFTGVLAATAAAAAPAAPGIQVGVTTGGAASLANEVLPLLVPAIENFTVPTINIKEIFVVYNIVGSISGLHVATADLGTVSASVPSGSSALTFALNGLSLDVQGNTDLKIWYLFIPTPCNAGLDVKLAADVTFDIGAAATADGHVQLSVSNVNVGIGALDIKFECGADGSILDTLIRWLTHLIKEKAASAMEAAISGVIGTVNQKLAGLPTVIDIPVGKEPQPWGVDIDTAVTSIGFDSAAPGYFSLALSGAFAPTLGPNKGSFVAPIPPPALPALDITPASPALTAYLSGYSVNSLFWALGQDGTLDATIAPSSLPAAANTTNSLAWELIAPGMAAAYPGAGVQLTIGLANGTSPSVTLAPSNSAFNALLELDVQAVPKAGGAATTAFTLLLGLTGAANVTVGPKAPSNDPALFLDIDSAAVNVTVGSTNVGAVNFVPQLSWVVDLLLNTTIIPKVNNITAEGVLIPQLVPGVKLTAATLESHNGYAELGATVALAAEAPTTEELAGAMSQRLGALVAAAQEPKKGTLRGAGADVRAVA